MVMEIRQWLREKLDVDGAERVIYADGSALYFVLDEVNKGACIQMSKLNDWEGSTCTNS